VRKRVELMLRGGFVPSKLIREDEPASAELLGRSAILYSNRPLGDREWKIRRIENAISHEDEGGEDDESVELTGNSVVVAHPSLAALATSTQRTTLRSTDSSIGLEDAKKAILEKGLLENEREMSTATTLGRTTGTRLPKSATPREVDGRRRLARPLSEEQQRRYPQATLVRGKWRRTKPPNDDDNALLADDQLTSSSAHVAMSAGPAFTVGGDIVVGELEEKPAPPSVSGGVSFDVLVEEVVGNGLAEGPRVAEEERVTVVTPAGSRPTSSPMPTSAQTAKHAVPVQKGEKEDLDEIDDVSYAINEPASRTPPSRPTASVGTSTSFLPAASQKARMRKPKPRPTPPSRRYLPPPPRAPRPPPLPAALRRLDAEVATTRLVGTSSAAAGVTKVWSAPTKLPNLRRHRPAARFMAYPSLPALVAQRRVAPSRAIDGRPRIPLPPDPPGPAPRPPDFLRDRVVKNKASASNVAAGGNPSDSGWRSLLDQGMRTILRLVTPLADTLVHVGAAISPI